MTIIYSSIFADPILLACIAGLAVVLAIGTIAGYVWWKVSRGDG
jgi:hypothetical protein